MRIKKIKESEVDVICSECAEIYCNGFLEGHIASFYPAVCDVCKEEKTCTQVRDYGYIKKELRTPERINSDEQLDKLLIAHKDIFKRLAKK